MFANLPLPFSMIALQGLDGALTAYQVRRAAWGADSPYEALAHETLADALPARFDTLSYMQKGDEALIVCEALSLGLVSWREKGTKDAEGTNGARAALGNDLGNNLGDDPFEALDELLPAQHLRVAHFDPVQGDIGLLFAEDGVLKRRLYVNTDEPAHSISTGILDAHEQHLWEASDLDGLESAEALREHLSALQADGQDHLQIVLTSLLANRLRFSFCLDLLNPSGAIWAESVASFCLDEDDSQ